MGRCSALRKEDLRSFPKHVYSNENFKLNISVRSALQITGTLVLAFVAGELCLRAGTPIPWMLGPLLATAALTLASVPTRSSTTLRNAGQWTMGMSLGLYFYPEVNVELIRLWWVVLLYIAWALILGMFIAGVLAHIHRGRMLGVTKDVLEKTTYFASAIGGASEMTLMAHSYGARADLVATAQSVRMLLVVTIVPFAVLVLSPTWNLHALGEASAAVKHIHISGLFWLTLMTGAGGLLLRRLRATNPWFLGPLFVAAALTSFGITLSDVPRVISNAAQLFIGVSLGVRFVPRLILNAPAWLISVVLSTLFVIGMSAGFGLFLAYLADIHPASAILATAPGGVTEMAITAKTLQLSVPLVTALQASRLVVVLVITKPIYLIKERKNDRHTRVMND